MGSLVACMYEHRPTEARRRRRVSGGVGLASAACGVAATAAVVAVQRYDLTTALAARLMVAVARGAFQGAQTYEGKEEGMGNQNGHSSRPIPARCKSVD